MYLKQSTASQTRLTPRFVDSTDFLTPETGLTIANTDVKLSKNGGASANKNSGGGTHIEGGRYALTFDATDTATVGELAVGINVAGALPVEFKFFVVEEAIYDQLFAASATGAVPSVTGAVGSVTGAVGSVTAVSSGAITEASFATTAGTFAPLGIIDQGTAQSATGTTLVLRSAAAFADDQIIGATIVITGGSAGVGQSRTITDYVSTTDTATVDTWTTTPTGTITYKIFATAASSGGGGGDATEAKQDTIIAAIAVIDDLLDSEIGTIITGLADVPTNAELATALGTADDAVLTQIALVKAKTDSLTFTVAGIVDANIQRINDEEITGDGQPGTLFDVA